MTKDTKPDDQILRHVAWLWARLCEKPNIDNGDKSFQGEMTKSLMRSTLNVATSEALDLYEQAIFEVLSSPTERGYWYRNIGSDYGPGAALQEAHAKLPEDVRAFDDPIKTIISYWSSNFITVSAGYGAPHINHYPLANGEWVAIPENDIHAVIYAFATGGKPTLQRYNPEKTTARFKAIDVWRSQ